MNGNLAMFGSVIHERMSLLSADSRHQIRGEVEVGGVCVLLIPGQAHLHGLAPPASITKLLNLQSP